jgi:large repetitive protein
MRTWDISHLLAGEIMHLALLRIIKHVRRFNLPFLVVVFSTVLLLTQQNCTRTQFVMDYASLVETDSPSALSSAVTVNDGKPSKKQINSAKLNKEQIEAVTGKSISKIRFSYDAEKINLLNWQDYNENISTDLENLFAGDGSKDGGKALIVDFLIDGQQYVRVYGDLLLDTTPPEVTYMNIENGQSNTTKNFTKAQLKASDNLTRITATCFKDSNELPTESEPCWSELPANTVLTGRGINVTDADVVLGFLQGEYTLHVFVRDEVGNISKAKNQNLIDKKSITYFPPTPPMVNLVHVAPVEDGPSTGISISKGQDVVVSWKISSSYPLIDKPISLYYTNNESNYSLIADKLTNSANSNCSIPTGSTGCMKIPNNNFGNQYFRIRVSVEDSNGQIAMNSSLPMNTDTFRILAGNTDSGLMGSATSAILFNHLSTNTYHKDEQSFVITNKGQIIFRDTSRGLLIADPKDGLLRTLLPFSSVLVNGSLNEATLHSRHAKIALDYSGNLIIADSNAIRKLDFKTKTVQNIVGGGSSLEDNVSSSNFKFTGCQFVCPLQVLPNGDIYFMTQSDYNRTFNDGARIRHFVAAEDKVKSYRPTGFGTASDKNLDLSNPKYVMASFIISFDPQTSQRNFVQLMVLEPVVGGSITYYSTLKPENFSSESTDFQYPASFAAGYMATSFATDKNGNVYAYSRLEAAAKKLNKESKAWDKILGTGLLGQCDDLTQAENCNVDLQDMFLGLQGRVFVMDRGRLRVITPEGQLFTVAGQSFSYGDKEKAIAARFGQLYYFDIDKNNQVIALDSTENRIRKINSTGLIDSIAGDGSNQSPDNSRPALNNPLYTSSWQGAVSFVIDRQRDHAYSTVGNAVFKLDLNTNRWSSVVGSGSTSYLFADNKAGSAVSFMYSPLILGFAENKLLLATNLWSYQNGGYIYGNALKLYNSQNDYTQTHLLGNGTTASVERFSVNTGNELTEVPTAFNSNISLASFDSVNNSEWFVGRTDTRTIIKIKEGEGQITQLFAELPRNFYSMTVVSGLDSSTSIKKQIIYYCATDGRLYSYDAASKVETKITWPHSSIKCSGYTVKFDAAQNRLIFPITQNGLSALAQMPVNPF